MNNNPGVNTKMWLDFLPLSDVDRERDAADRAKWDDIIATSAVALTARGAAAAAPGQPPLDKDDLASEEKFDPAIPIPTFYQVMFDEIAAGGSGGGAGRGQKLEVTDLTSVDALLTSIGAELNKPAEVMDPIKRLFSDNWYSNVKELRDGTQWTRLAGVPARLIDVMCVPLASTPFASLCVLFCCAVLCCAVLCCAVLSCSQWRCVWSRVQKGQNCCGRLHARASAVQRPERLSLRALSHTLRAGTKQSGTRVLRALCAVRCALRVVS
jgi:hypothetical protein